MERKELLHSSNKVCVLLFSLVWLITVSCRIKNAGTAQQANIRDYTVDTGMIPKDTILQSDPRLIISNGVYFVYGLPYSGVIKLLYPGGNVHAFISLLNGRMHGSYKSFYEDGSRFESRMYRNNLATGKHFGYWPGGRYLKFDYNYYEEKKEGPQKKWYKDGRPYLFTNYLNDREDGLQQGWRENGKLFLNYVVRDGYTYGMQQTALCYTLLKENIKPAPTRNE